MNAPPGTTDPAALPETLILVPNSGIQFVEYSFHLDKVPRFQRPFIEREFPDERDAQTGEIPVRLLAGWNEEFPDTGEPPLTQYSDRIYSLTPVRALEPFLGKWVPVPYIAHLRVDPLGAPATYRNGPTNWARARVVQVNGSEDTPVTHKVVFAFDTTIDDHDPPLTFTTPAQQHTGPGWEFSYVSRFRDLHWFVHNPDPDGSRQDYGLWVRDWVERLFQAFKYVQRRGRPPRSDEDQGRLEALARYFVFLETLNQAISPRKMRFVDMKTSGHPVDVDLVLDVGNSRTYGILIERIPNKLNADLKDSYTLKLRDLQDPTLVYSGAFESHVELFCPSFGDEDLSRRSGRARAFFWPSVVRVGPEASRIRDSQDGTEGYSGLSSPKRYLWDLRPVQQEWRFPKDQYIGEDEPSLGKRLRNLVNASGESLSQLKRSAGLLKRVYDGGMPPDAAQAARTMNFSRSSMYALMMAEVVWQAMTMINNPVGRLDRPLAEIPRRLSRIILTLPAATPVREQLLVKLRAQGAIQLLWDLMGWPADDRRFLQPTVQAAWDEASCVQLVWLFGEIAGKYGGRIEDFLELAGRPRKRIGPDSGNEKLPDDEPSIRVATVDVGGGTTDLMITTYYVDGGRRLTPIQNFREGIRLAGDDVLRAVIERIVLPALERGMKVNGIPKPELQLRTLFGGDRADLREQDRHLRRQFVLRVLRPIALGLLRAYEDVEGGERAAAGTRKLGSFFGEGTATEDSQLGIDPRILNYVRGGHDLSLAGIEVPLDFDGVAEATRSVLSGVFDNICEALHRFDCDVVLLSGRPSRLPAVSRLLIDKLALAPDRIVCTHLYKPGRWYPLPDYAHEDRIGDPKTTAAVGGMLCALSERELLNFALSTEKLQMRSIANYVGQLENDGTLLDKRVLFEVVEIGAQGVEDVKPTDYYTKMRLGYRQIPVERWVTSPLYQVWLEQLNPAFRVATPITIRFSRQLELAEDEHQDAVLDAEARKEELRIIEAFDANGDPVRVNKTPPPDARTTNWASLQMIFRTLTDEEGYWLDTGILGTY